MNELLKREISNVIFREVKDPRLKGLININDVDVASDFKSAKVYVSIFGVDEEVAKTTFKGLISAVNFIKYKVSKHLRLKYTPDLKFILDTSIEKGFTIIEKLDKIKEELENKNVE